jgi:hypothetical protein
VHNADTKTRRESCQLLIQLRTGLSNQHYHSAAAFSAYISFLRLHGRKGFVEVTDATVETGQEFFSRRMTDQLWSINL